MPRAQKAPPKRVSKPTVVSGAALARHLDVSPNYIGRLARDGVIPRRPDGRYDQDECRRAYLKHLRRPGARANVSAAHSDLRKAQARLVRLKVARLEGQLMEVEDHIAVVEGLAGLVVSTVESWPAAVARHDLALRRKLELEVYALRERLSAAAAEQAERCAREERAAEMGESPDAKS